jgi:type I restriction enzyme S subunit
MVSVLLQKKGLENSSARLLPKGTVLLTSRAPIGYVAIAENEICTNQGFKSLVPNPDKAHNLFLLYWIKSNVEYLQSIGTGTTFQEISGSVLKDVDIILPPLPEQKAIAEVLSSLDDKIDLLTRQNKTLEDLAQAYFRKWFIEDASKEWEVVPISEKFDVLLGGTPSRKIESYWTNGTIGWINSGKINEFRIIEASEYITEEALNNSSAKLLPAGTTVLAITGATLGKISMVLRSFAANQSVIGLVPKAELSNNFIFLWLKENINALISMQTGGAQQHINSNDVKSFDVIVPDTVALSLFRRKIDPLMLKISQNCFQIKTFQKLRDTLLPKLISGEIRLKM